MKISALFDNAIFLKNFREGMRFPRVASATLMVGIITLLIFFGYYFASKDPSSSAYHSQKFWIRDAFLSFTVFQGILLLGFGTLAVNRMTSREKNGGTLDFHRSSPSSRWDQIIGLVLGAPILEWALFAGTLVLAFIIALIKPFPLTDILTFYVGLILSALFLHAAWTLGILAGSRRQSQGGLLFLIFLGSWFLLPLMFTLNQSVIYHATCFPAYEFIWQRLADSDGLRGSQEFALHSFLGRRMPFLLLQAIVQLAFLWFIYAGIKRKISHPERSLFSKTQSALLSALILFLYWGSSASAFFTQNSYRGDHAVVAAVFFYLLFFIGLFSALTATPSYLDYTKGLRRAQKLGLKKLRCEDDQSSNILWLGTYGVILTVFYFIFVVSFLPGTLLRKILYHIIILSQVVFFASAWEYFSFSRYHQKKIYFGTAMLILWFVLPIVGLITSPLAHSKAYPLYFAVLSPPWLPPIFAEMFTSQSWRQNINNFDFPVVFAVIANSLSAAWASWLAFQERRKIQARNTDIPRH